MKLSDISHVKVDWMEKFSNDPELKFVLKAGRKLTPWADFRFRQKGQMFFAEHEGEVRFVAHDPRDHNGFGFAHYALVMEDGYDPQAAGWRDCNIIGARDHGSMCNRDVRCYYDPPTNTIHLTGPWSSGSVAMERAFGVATMGVSTLEPEYNNKLRSPRYYQRMQKQGRGWDGTYMAVHYTLDFVREAVDKLAPHLELWQGDYGWTVKLRDMPPKRERRQPQPIGHPLLSEEQSFAVYI